MLNGDLLFVCEQINSPEICCLELAFAAVCCVDEVTPATEPALSVGLLLKKAQPGRGRESVQGRSKMEFSLGENSDSRLQAVGFVAWSSSAAALPKHFLTCPKREPAAVYTSVTKTEKTDQSKLFECVR